MNTHLEKQMANVRPASFKPSETIAAALANANAIMDEAVANGFGGHFEGRLETFGGEIAPLDSIEFRMEGGDYQEAVVLMSSKSLKCHWVADIRNNNPTPRVICHSRVVKILEKGGKK